MGPERVEPSAVPPTRRSLREAERRAAAAAAPQPVPSAPVPASHPSWLPTARAASSPAPSVPPGTAQAADQPHAVVQPVAVVQEPPAVQAPSVVGSAPTGLAATADAPVVATAQARTAPRRPAPQGTARRAGRPSRLVVRLGVLGALAGGTVVIPAVSQGAFAGSGVSGYDALADSTLPSTVSVLTSSPLSALPPASLVSTDGALASRLVSEASRDDERSALADCDGSTRAAGQNGLLKVADLCTLWDGHTELRADAAVSLAEFNQAFVARFGGDLCLSSGYRTLAQQRAVKAQKGGLAAPPGKSNHGWGLAVDLCQDQTSGAKWAWLNENGPNYGWQNPSWARPGGSGPFERWHWEYVKGVKADGEYYG